MLKCVLSVATLFAGGLAVAAPPDEKFPGKLLPAGIASPYTVAAVAFSPDGALLAVAGGQVENRLKKEADAAELVLWDVKTRKKVVSLTGHKTRVNSVAFSPDGKTLASASLDKTVRLWDVKTGKELAVLADARLVMSLVFSPDGKTLAGAVWPDGWDEGDWAELPGKVVLWDVETRKVRARLEGHGGNVFQVAFSPDGKTLAAASAWWDKGPIPEGEYRWYTTGEVRLWDPATGKQRKTLTGHKGARITTLAFSPDGKSFATGAFLLPSDRSEAGLWDAGTGKLTATVGYDHTYLDCLAFSPDGTFLAARKVLHNPDDWVGEVALLDPRTLKTVAKLPGSYSPAQGALAFAPKQRILAVPDGKEVKIWDLSEVK